jgi:hypothetical protein
MTEMISELRIIAKARGGYCLSPSQIEYSPKKFVWKCDKGHIWEARADHVLTGSWCPTCHHEKQKKTIDEMKELAKKREGECLSQVYESARTRLTWKCKEGHIFEATPAKIKVGRWCKECGDQVAGIKRRIPMQEIQALASSHGGKCLSEKYNPKDHLKWQCEFGHTWNASVHNVKAGHWCPVCGHKKSGRKILTIDEMQNLAASHGGKCLSTNYTNVESHLKWMCENGHIWLAIPSSIKKGSWCPVCAGNEMLDMEQIQKTAQERGGKCLSTNYEGVHQKLQWQCSEGHIWYANYANISMGRWCPECSAGIGERITREYFEQIFGKKFPKTRPSWLINHDGFQMELDGYCKELALAFEHQGSQHYIQNDYFHHSDSQFQKRQADDRRKKALCKKNRITLIEIPQIPDALPLSKVQTYIFKRCENKGIKIPRKAEEIKVKLRRAFSLSTKEKMQEIHNIAIGHGGKCLSQIYLGLHVKLQFQCEKGHEWETEPAVILKGHWCHKCSTSKLGFSRRLTIDEMNQLAKERGGRCLSKEYMNANSHLLWECSQGHQWRAIPDSIKRGSWCPICSNKLKTGRRKI